MTVETLTSQVASDVRVLWNEVTDSLSLNTHVHNNPTILLKRFAPRMVFGVLPVSTILMYILIWHRHSTCSNKMQWYTPTPRCFIVYIVTSPLRGWGCTDYTVYQAATAPLAAFVKILNISFFFVHTTLRSWMPCLMSYVKESMLTLPSDTSSFLEVHFRPVVQRSSLYWPSYILPVSVVPYDTAT